MTSPHLPSGTDGFRNDIEGLRGVAVLIVVLFHAGLLSMAGGFIGVDVFFVISGYLITGLLLREVARSGTVDITAFYARRIRRLLPAATVTIVVTLAAALVLVPPLDRSSIAADASAAAMSVANIRFAASTGDYFATVSTPSPFLHFWSLSVEEQFYLVWPALILVIARVGRGVRRFALALALLSIVAFAANLVITDIAPTWAFYLLPTRAWQLGIGGLLAMAAGWISARRWRLLPLLGWGGLAAIVAASFLFDSSVPYPGLGALVPTLATAALLTCGMAPWGPGRVLASAPMRFLGRISYSLYLWHWPVLALAPFAIGRAPDSVTQGLLVALSVALAYLSYRCIETPFRTGAGMPAAWRSRPIRMGTAMIAAVVLLSTGISFSTGTIDTVGASSDTAVVAGAANPADGDTDADDSTAWVDAAPIAADDAAAATSDDPETAPSLAEEAPGGGQASPVATASAATAVPSSAAPAASPTPSAAPQGPIPLPKNVTPSLSAARGDEERLRRDGCLAFEMVVQPPDCVYGVTTGSRTIALVGDSHAAQWFPALERTAKHEGWRLVVFTKVSCPFIDMRVVNLALKRDYRECTAWNDRVVTALRALHPDLVLISVSRTATHPLSSADDTIDARAAALARMIGKVRAPAALIVDTPYAGFDVPACLSAHSNDIRACRIPHATAFSGGLGKAERAAAAASGAGIVDLTGNVCPGSGACPVVVGGHIVFRDQGHLTATFARSLAPALAAAIEPLLGS